MKHLSFFELESRINNLERENAILRQKLVVLGKGRSYMKRRPMINDGGMYANSFVTSLQKKTPNLCTIDVMEAFYQLFKDEERVLRETPSEWRYRVRLSSEQVRVLSLFIEKFH